MLRRAAKCLLLRDGIIFEFCRFSAEFKEMGHHIGPDLGPILWESAVWMHLAFGLQTCDSAQSLSFVIPCYVGQLQKMTKDIA